MDRIIYIVFLIRPKNIWEVSRERRFKGLEHKLAEEKRNGH